MGGVGGMGVEELEEGSENPFCSVTKVYHSYYYLLLLLGFI